MVQSSDSRWAAAPHRPHEPDRASRQDQPDQPTTGRPAVPPKDDIVGWPNEFLIDLPDFPDRTLDSVATDPMGFPELVRLDMRNAPMWHAHYEVEVVVLW